MVTAVVPGGPPIIDTTALATPTDELAAALAKQFGQVAIDRYAEGFADGVTFGKEQIAASVEKSLAIANGLVEAYREQLEAAQESLAELSNLNIADENVISLGRLFALELMHYAFSPILEGEGTTKNEAPNPLLYSPAMIVYANSFLAMITLHALRISTPNPEHARELMMEAIDEADKVMVTTEKLNINLNVDKLGPQPDSA